jgi:hypothetical protein
MKQQLVRFWDWMSHSPNRHDADEQPHHGWRAGLVVAILAGLVIVATFAQRPNEPLLNSTAATALLLSFACVITGGLVGFLFGIPRSLQHKQVPDTAKEPGAAGGPEALGYRPNTNLEEISDWLTKILVGVGLTQLLQVPEHLARFAAYCRPALGGNDVAERFALAILLFFPSCGFLFGYLWTRLFLGGALREADRLAQIERKLNAQEEQAQADAAALALTYQHLAPGPSKVDVDKLKKVVAGASPSVKVTIFNQARTVRSASWDTDKALMERTIPIFEALVESDVERKFHRNFGQLGYALKDQHDPNWARAEQALSTAIRIRGPEGGWDIYELNRALCRIMQDPDYAAKRPSAPAIKERILADLRIGWHSGVLRQMFAQDPIRDWIRLNGVTEALVERGEEDS